MGSNFINSLIIIAAFSGSIANAGIFLDGNLQTENSLDLFNSLYNNTDIALTGNSVLNIYYGDSVESGVYQPAFNFSVKAEDNAVVNLYIPENDNPDFSLYLWDTAGNLSANFIDLYPGLVLNSSNYSTITYTELWRSYGSNVSQVLSPYVGSLQLFDASTMNIVPEPASLALFAIGGLILRRKHK